MLPAAQLTYRKTAAGEWVAYGPISIVQVGRCQITKQDGTTKAETITRVGRPFDVHGVTMCYGYLGGTNTPAPRASRATAKSRCKSGTGDCLSFGVRGCYECGS